MVRVWWRTQYSIAIRIWSVVITLCGMGKSTVNSGLRKEVEQAVEDWYQEMNEGSLTDLPVETAKGFQMIDSSAHFIQTQKLLCTKNDLNGASEIIHIRDELSDLSKSTEQIGVENILPLKDGGPWERDLISESRKVRRQNTIITGFMQTITYLQTFWTLQAITQGYAGRFLTWHPPVRFLKAKEHKEL